MNYVWFFLVAVAVITAVFTGSVEAVTQAALDSAGAAVTIAINLIGIMTLWLGIMKIAEEAGLVRLLARGFSLSAVFFFPVYHPIIRNRGDDTQPFRQLAWTGQCRHPTRNQGHGKPANPERRQRDRF